MVRSIWRCHSKWAKANSTMTWWLETASNLVRYTPRVSKLTTILVQVQMVRMISRMMKGSRPRKMWSMRRILRWGGQRTSLISTGEIHGRILSIIKSLMIRGLICRHCIPIFISMRIMIPFFLWITMDRAIKIDSKVISIGVWVQIPSGYLMTRVYAVQSRRCHQLWSAQPRESQKAVNWFAVSAWARKKKVHQTSRATPTSSFVRANALAPWAWFTFRAWKSGSMARGWSIKARKFRVSFGRR